MSMLTTRAYQFASTTHRLVSDHTHLSLPSQYIRQLDSPTEVLLFWDEVIALQDYMQIRHGFGWDPMANAIRTYVQADQSTLPRTNQQKIDQRLIKP